MRYTVPGDVLKGTLNSEIWIRVTDGYVKWDQKRPDKLQFYSLEDFNTKFGSIPLWALAVTRPDPETNPAICHHLKVEPDTDPESNMGTCMCGMRIFMGSRE